MSNFRIDPYKEMPDAAKLAKVYNISASSVYRLVRRMKDTGSVDLRTGSRGRKSSLTSEDIENIRRTVIEQPDITIHEINVKLGLSVCDETIRLKVVAMGLREKAFGIMRCSGKVSENMLQ